MTRNWQEMVRLGGNLFFILKISAVDPVRITEIGAHQAGMDHADSCAIVWEEIRMAKLIGGLGTSHVPSIGAALDKGLRDSPDWKAFFDGYIPGQEWVKRAQAGRGRGDLQRPRQHVLPRQGADLRRRLRRRISPRRRGMGAACHRAVQGRGRLLVAFHRHAGRESLRPDDLPGDRGRPRHCRFRWSCSGAARRMAGEGRADLRQRDPVPDPAAEPLLRDGPRSAKAIESYDSDERFVILGTGGLSHQLQGARAGFVNPEADRPS